LHTKLQFKFRNARDNFKVIGMNEMILLKWIINKKDRNVWTGFISLTRGMGCGVI